MDSGESILGDCYCFSNELRSRRGVKGSATGGELEEDAWKLSKFEGG
jgi:hypothetical protein